MYVSVLDSELEINELYLYLLFAVGKGLLFILNSKLQAIRFSDLVQMKKQYSLNFYFKKEDIDFFNERYKLTINFHKESMSI